MGSSRAGVASNSELQVGHLDNHISTGVACFRCVSRDPQPINAKPRFTDGCSSRRACALVELFQYVRCACALVAFLWGGRMRLFALKLFRRCLELTGVLLGLATNCRLLAQDFAIEKGLTTHELDSLLLCPSS